MPLDGQSFMSGLLGAYGQSLHEKKLQDYADTRAMAQFYFDKAKDEELTDDERSQWYARGLKALGAKDKDIQQVMQIGRATSNALSRHFAQGRPQAPTPVPEISTGTPGYGEVVSPEETPSQPPISSTKPFNKMVSGWPTQQTTPTPVSATAPTLAPLPVSPYTTTNLTPPASMQRFADLPQPATIRQTESLGTPAIDEARRAIPQEGVQPPIPEASPELMVRLQTAAGRKQEAQLELYRQGVQAQRDILYAEAQEKIKQQDAIIDSYPDLSDKERLRLKLAARGNIAASKIGMGEGIKAAIGYTKRDNRIIPLYRTGDGRIVYQETDGTGEYKPYLAQPGDDPVKLGAYRLVQDISGEEKVVDLNRPTTPAVTVPGVTSPVAAKLKLAMANFRLNQQRLYQGAARLDLARKKFARQGIPIKFADENGNPKETYVTYNELMGGGVWNVPATTLTRSRVEGAKIASDAADDLIDTIYSMKDKLGGIRGYMQKYLAHTPFADKDLSELYQSLVSFAQTLGAPHGIRAQKVTTDFLQRVSEANSADTLAAAVRGAVAVSNQMMLSVPNYKSGTLSPIPQRPVVGAPTGKTPPSSSGALPPVRPGYKRVWSNKKQMFMDVPQ